MSTARLTYTQTYTQTMLCILCVLAYQCLTHAHSGTIYTEHKVTDRYICTIESMPWINELLHCVRYMYAFIVKVAQVSLSSNRTQLQKKTGKRNKWRFLSPKRDINCMINTRRVLAAFVASLLNASKWTQMQSLAEKLRSCHCVQRVGVRARVHVCG